MPVFYHYLRLNTFSAFFTDILVSLPFFIIQFGFFKTTTYFLFDHWTPSTWHSLKGVTPLLVAVSFYCFLLKLSALCFAKIILGLGLLHLVKLFGKYIFWRLD